ncbi:DNA-processing protein DprA [Patescibacteria group bacterium]
MQKDIKILNKNEVPEQLLEIPEPPEKLYLRGELPSADTKLLCVIGSRKYSNYGKDVCEELIKGLAGYDIAIVSGLAIGIDAIAHHAAIKAGLKTIAVPGSGISEDVLYPASNQPLAREILSHGGALISEFEPNFRATVWSFPKRNRVMAGLCDAVLIIEAAERSGTLITARLALDYNRDVLVVPNSIFSEHAKGSNSLVRRGATPITSSADLLQELGFDQSHKKVSSIEKNLSENEQKVISLLNEPLARDDLIRQLKIETSEANILLSAMEIKGLIKESLGLLRKS